MVHSFVIKSNMRASEHCFLVLNTLCQKDVWLVHVWSFVLFVSVNVVEQCSWKYKAWSKKI